MQSRSRPTLLFCSLLLLIAAGGAVLLAQPNCTTRDPRDLQYFNTRHYWQCAFDALSAATGCGLLTYRLDQDYTPQGRWTLLAIGLAGFALYIATAAAAAHRAALFPANLRPPRPLTVLSYFLCLAVVVLIPSAWPIEQSAHSDANLADATWRTLSFLCGLGWVGELPGRSVAFFAAGIGGLSLLGWWPLLIVPRMRDRSVRFFNLLRPFAGMIVVLAVWMGLLFVFDLPRGQKGGGDAEAEWKRTQERSAVIATESASEIGVGLPGESPKPAQLPDGAKLTLALATLIGGLGIGGAGGIGLLFTYWAIGGAIRSLYRRTTSDPPGRTHRTRVALAAVVGFFSLSVVFALGLLLIEWTTAARFQEQPSFADALLESASALGGSAVTSGLTATVTSRNLTSGIQLPINMYQVGMVWLMLAMFLGRIIPIAALHRLGDPLPVAAPQQAPPQI